MTTPLERLERPAAGDPGGRARPAPREGCGQHDLYPLLDVLDPDRRLLGVTPQGPLQLPPGGRHWYRLAGIPTPDPVTFHGSLPLLRELLDGLPVPRERVVLGGFSQGAVMSWAVWLGNGEERPAAVVALSGFVPRVDGCSSSRRSRRLPGRDRTRHAGPRDPARVRPRGARPARRRRCRGHLAGEPLPHGVGSVSCCRRCASSCRPRSTSVPRPRPRRSTSASRSRSPWRQSSRRAPAGAVVLRRASRSGTDRAARRRAGATDVDADGAGGQRVVHLLIGAVVSDGEHEVPGLSGPPERAGSRRSPLLTPLARTSTTRCPSKDLGGRAVEELLDRDSRSSFDRHAAVLRLGLPIVPGDARRLPLDERARHLAPRLGGTGARPAAAMRGRCRRAVVQGRPGTRDANPCSAARATRAASPNQRFERVAARGRSRGAPRSPAARRGHRAAREISSVGAASSGSGASSRSVPS